MAEETLENRCNIAREVRRLIIAVAVGAPAQGRLGTRIGLESQRAGVKHVALYMMGSQEQSFEGGMLHSQLLYRASIIFRNEFGSTSGHKATQTLYCDQIGPSVRSMAEVSELNNTYTWSAPCQYHWRLSANLGTLDESVMGSL
jgi:hypothetical protein